MPRIALAVGLLALAVAVPAAAIDFVPTRYDDPTPDGCLPSDCSLREAVIAANQSPGLDRIDLSAGIYVLLLVGEDDDLGLTGDLDILDDLEIRGVATGLTMLYTPGTSRILHVLNVDTTLTDLLFAAGASGDGAGVKVIGGTSTIERCEFYGNQDGFSLDAQGGATLTMRASTIAENSAGFSCSQSICAFENVTIAQNTNSTWQVFVDGNGVIGATFTCSHCTIFADDLGAATVHVQGSLSTATFANSIVQGQCAVADGGTIDSQGGNLEASADTCSFDQASDVVNAFSPGLLPLGDYGGGTRTLLPQFDGPVADKAVAANCLTHDQTGFARPYDGDSVPGAECDMGAAEAGSPRPLTPLFVDDFRQGSTAAWTSTVP